MHFNFGSSDTILKSLLLHQNFEVEVMVDLYLTTIDHWSICIILIWSYWYIYLHSCIYICLYVKFWSLFFCLYINFKAHD